MYPCMCKVLYHIYVDEFFLPSGMSLNKDVYLHYSISHSSPSVSNISLFICTSDRDHCVCFKYKMDIRTLLRSKCLHGGLCSPCRTVLECAWGFRPARVLMLAGCGEWRSVFLRLIQPDWSPVFVFPIYIWKQNRKLIKQCVMYDETLFW